MSSTLIGSREIFAIEYNIIDSNWQPFGNLGLCVKGKFISDFNDRMFLASTCDRLTSLLTRKRNWPFVYSNVSDVPDDDQVFSKPSFFSGEAFDAFGVRAYSVESESRIHFLWELDEQRRPEFPTYPVGRHHETISFSQFDPIVKEFLVKTASGTVVDA